MADVLVSLFNALGLALVAVAVFLFMLIMTVLLRPDLVLNYMNKIQAWIDKAHEDLDEWTCPTCSKKDPEWYFTGIDWRDPDARKCPKCGNYLRRVTGDRRTNEDPRT